jgi:AcrR family transcriptional regulator
VEHAPHSTSPARRAGRPARGEVDADVREALLEAAAMLFAERGSDAVGIRELGRAARVTPAMIAYYFGDKQGLLTAVAERAFERFLARVRELAGALDGRAFAPALIELYIDVIGREPWIALFVMREVLSRDGPLRRSFVKRFAAEAARHVPARMRAEIEGGRLRADLDPVLALVSLISLSVFPFLAEPVMGPLLGFRNDPEFRRRLTEHTVRLYLEGAGSRA